MRRGALSSANRNSRSRVRVFNNIYINGVSLPLYSKVTANGGVKSTRQTVQHKQHSTKLRVSAFCEGQPSANANASYDAHNTQWVVLGQAQTAAPMT